MLSPPYDQMWFASAPRVKGPDILRTTAVGPAPQRPVPRNGSEVVGIRRTGPAPQMKDPGFAGDRKNDVTRAAHPDVGCPPGTRGGWLTTGTIRRAIRFQSSFTEKGITGWKFMM